MLSSSFSSHLSFLLIPILHCDFSLFLRAPPFVVAKRSVKLASGFLYRRSPERRRTTNLLEEGGRKEGSGRESRNEAWDKMGATALSSPSSHRSKKTTKNIRPSKRLQRDTIVCPSFQSYQGCRFVLADATPAPLFRTDALAFFLLLCLFVGFLSCGKAIEAHSSSIVLSLI